MSFLDRLFNPPRNKNTFDLNRYLKDLRSGAFRNKMNLGVCEEKGGSWLLKDFTQEPNAVFIGAMGSGKSVAANFSIQTWMMSNSDQTVLFVVDTLKGANDYATLFEYPQVYQVLNSESGVHRVLDLLYEEAMRRKEEFNEMQAENIYKYEEKMSEKTGEPFKLARCIVLIEEFHAIPYVILDYDRNYKVDQTSAFKFHQLMKIGRSYGLWIVACSQRGLKSDIPSEIVQNFTQKQIFRTSKAEASYFLSDVAAAEIRSDQKGRCETDYGSVQFPYMPEKTQAVLLKEFMRPLEAVNLYLNDKLINDYLEGKSTVELYKHKKISDLCISIESKESDIVIQILHEKLGHSVDLMDSKIDPYGISMTVDWPNKGKVAVAVRANAKKLAAKHLLSLEKGMKTLGCSRGIIYTSSEEIPSSLYKMAVDKRIELVDHEDLVRLARQIEAKTKQELSEISPDRLADDSKESGEYQTEHHIKDVDLNAEEESDDELDLDDVKMPVKDKEESVLLKREDGIIEVTNPNNPTKPSIAPEAKTTFIKNLEAKEEKAKDSRQILAEILQEEPESESVVFPASTPSPTDAQNAEDLAKISEAMLITTSKNVKSVKRVAARGQFFLKREESPELLIHVQKNASGEPYRVLFCVLVNRSIRHKYFLDRQVSGEFSVVDKAKLNIDSTADWNSQRDEANGRPVYSADKFDQELIAYLDNFKSYEFGNVRAICWQEDEAIVRQWMMKSRHMEANPIVIEELAAVTFGDQLDREMLIAQNSMSIKRQDIYMPLEIDHQIWKAVSMM